MYLPPFLKKRPTLQGVLAILIWSSASLQMCFLSDLSSIQVASICMILSGLVSIAAIIRTNGYTEIKKAPLYGWFVALLLPIMKLSYVAAFKVCAPVTVDVVYFSWPVLGVLLSFFVFRTKVKTRHLVAIMISLYAVYIMQGGSGSASFSGIWVPLITASSFSLYSVLVEHGYKPKPNVLGCVFFIVGTSGLVYALGTGQSFIQPTLKQVFVILFFSFANTFLAIHFWTTGCSKGRQRLLSVIFFCQIIVSAAFLIAFGYASLTHRLILAAMLVTLGSMLSAGGAEKIISSVKAAWRSLLLSNTRRLLGFFHLRGRPVCPQKTKEFIADNITDTETEDLPVADDNKDTPISTKDSDETETAANSKSRAATPPPSD